MLGHSTQGLRPLAISVFVFAVLHNLLLLMRCRSRGGCRIYSVLWLDIYVMGVIACIGLPLAFAYAGGVRLYGRSLTLALSHSHTLTHAHTHALTHAHAHIHTHKQTNAHTRTLTPPCVRVSLSFLSLPCPSPPPLPLRCSSWLCDHFLHFP